MRPLKIRCLVLGLSILALGLMPFSSATADDWVLGYFKSYVEKQVSKTAADVKKALSPKEKSEALLKSASEGKGNDVQQLLKDGADPNSRGKGGATPLMLACLGGHTEVGNILLKSKADIEAKDNEGFTALCFAAAKGDREMVKLLLKPSLLGSWFGPKGANVNASAINGVTPLMYAAHGGHLEVVKILLGAGADPNAKSKSWSLLGFSVGSGDTALTIAEKQRHAKVVKLLKEKVAK